jgi:hypothetical protein
MFSKTKVALSAAMVLSTAFSASAATKHRRVAHAHPGIYNTTAPARSDQYPVLDVAPVCRGISSQSSLEAGLRNTSFDECMKGEQSDREAMIKEWSTFNSDDKRHCIAETTMGGESSYTDLITCLEMSRDVRKLHSDEHASSATQQATPPPDTPSAPDQQPPPAPVGHRQPTRQ